VRDGWHGGIENRRIHRLHEKPDRDQPGQQPLGGGRQRDVIGICQVSAQLGAGERRINDGLRLADQTAQVRIVMEALGVDLVNVLGP
jgi:hypothetical protein